MRRWATTRVACLTLLLVLPAASPAYETDQFSHRLEPITDSRDVLNEKVNQTIADIVAHWRGGPNQSRFVNAIYHRIGGIYWVDKLEAWAMKSPKVERLETPRHHSIFSGIPFWATRVASLFGIGPTIKVNGVLIGTDKLGHFLSQGRKFWRRYQRYHDVERAARQSAFTERAIFGQLTTGAYSNADLVANFEGYRFYRGLFEDNIVDHKPAILRWQEDHWVIQRPFDFADHVNDYWDEALNIDDFDSLLYPYMKKRLMTFCDEYFEDPDSFVVHHEAELKKRYAKIQLRDSSELRLNNLCARSADRPASAAPGSQPD